MGILVEMDKGDFDYVWARVGGLDVFFMFIFIFVLWEDNGVRVLVDFFIDMVVGII